MNAAAHEMAFELGHLAHEFGVFRFATKAHDALDAGAVVPTAIKHHDFATRREMLDVALEVPLSLFRVRGFFERDDASAARVEVLHEALDRASLTGGVASFKEDHHALAAFLHPSLQLQ